MTLIFLALLLVVTQSSFTSNFQEGVWNGIFGRNSSILPTKRSFQEYTKKHMVVSFVNGIYHTEADLHNITSTLQSIFSEEIRSFYNPSSGWWIGDLSKAGLDLFMKPKNTDDIAKKLADHLKAILKDIRENGRILHIAHSGGAILTYLAAKHHLSAQETNRIDIVTLGGGRSLTHKYFRGRIRNYYSRNDPLLAVDQRAGGLLKEADKATKNNLENKTVIEIWDKKYNTSFLFIKAQANHPILDHSADGATYRIALEREAIDFRNRLLLMDAMDKAERDFVHLFRKRMANLTGVHHFWSSFTLRRIRKQAASTTNIHGFFSKKYHNKESAFTKLDHALTISSLAEHGLQKKGDLLLNETEYIQQIIRVENNRLDNDLETSKGEIFMERNDTNIVTHKKCIVLEQNLNSKSEPRPLKIPPFS